MSTNERPSTYGALAGDAYRSLVNATEAVNADAIGYVRSLFEIFSKPYTPIERSAATLGATLDVVAANNRHAAGLARDLANIVSTAHEAYVAGLRNIADTGVSNLEFVKDATMRNARVTLPLPSVN